MSARFAGLGADGEVLEEPVEGAAVPATDFGRGFAAPVGKEKAGGIDFSTAIPVNETAAD